ncbi:mechanosensitive ion channel [Echinicola jeungdonensis]|uniref:Mechanosensitive ion channel family protein n=1 Tax=Echinicola jeungdonensis TaxID=709343 RepID=A0ABV5J2Z7_9BACT|nr:mechanosensitive ion channel domain-containing protein [Echinicola jeungdonensis]MDN3668524.1 mechanosensitive ion channel [Echinicola jeungdonensis]
MNSKKDTIDKNEENNTSTNLIYEIERYIIDLNHLITVLERGLDTTDISSNLPEAANTIQFVRQKLKRDQSPINLRYLSALSDLSDNIRVQIKSWKKDIDERGFEIKTAYDSLAQIKRELTPQISEGDTTFIPEFQKQVDNLQDKWQTADSLYRVKYRQVSSFQSQLSRTIVEIGDFRDEIQERRRLLERKLFQKENNYLWEKGSDPKEEQGLGQVISRSLKLNEIILKGFIQLHWPAHIWVLAFSAILLFWYKYMLKHIKSEKEFSDIILHRVQFIPKKTITSALIVVFSVAPFFYRSPPVVFTTSILFITVLLTTYLIHKNIDKKLFTSWIIFVVIFTIYCISNLYVEIAFQERYILLFTSVIGILLGVFTLKTIRKTPKKNPNYLHLLIKFFLLIQSFSLVANILGRYSLSKILGVAGITSLMQAISLYMFVKVIMEALYLQVEMSKKNKSHYTAYFDFQNIKERVQTLFIGISLIIWAYFLAFNLSVYDFLYNNAVEFLMEPRTLGGNTFNFGSVLIFILVIWISFFLAKYIAYFAEIKDQQKAGSRKQRLGSSVLLIRLAVLMVGFLFALTASGIPLDKVAIVVGALSVGIGFGLQTIVNNLVSGVILAFERPIQIGDAIEVGGRSGMVKEVGIRSSRIQAYDGSEVIIPNGDLLSQHLINWTLSDKKKRIELIIGVAYSSDTKKVVEVFKKVLNRENILKSPEPEVYLQNFADSAIEFRLLFWVSDFDTWIEIRGEVMGEIQKAFEEEGIQIPFPQRDLYIKTFPKLDSQENSDSDNQGEKS